MRVDTESIYTALKAALGEEFGAYRVAIADFMLGKTNQNELSKILSQLLSPAPSVSTNPSSSDVKDSKLTSTIHLHNQLLCALYANMFREPPPDIVAPWVLAPDDATGQKQHAAKTAGARRAADEVDERLKREIMALTGRDRRRIKNVQDGSNEDHRRETGPLTQSLTYNQALTVPTSQLDPEANPQEGKAGLGKTNWDIEIRRRYAMPLAVETLEFPSRSEIQSRIEPICYEEGLGLNAPTPLSNATLQSCAELVETATEMFVKEMLERCIAHSRTNGEGMPLTHAFRKQLNKEEEAVERGELARTPAGLLPCEADVAATREPLSTDELRLNLRLDQGRLPLDPFLAQKILEDIEIDVPEGYDVSTPPDIPNGLSNGLKGRAVTHDAADPMILDDDEPGWGWPGAGEEDRNDLMGVLDSALTTVAF